MRSSTDTTTKTMLVLALLAALAVLLRLGENLLGHLSPVTTVSIWFPHTETSVSSVRNFSFKQQKP